MLAQFAPGYPNNNNNYNNNIYPTFSNLNVISYTTPAPYAYGNIYLNPYTNPLYQQQLGSNKIRIWPFVIGQYIPDQYSNYNYNNNNNKPNNILYPTWQTWYQQSLGKKK